MPPRTTQRRCMRRPASIRKFFIPTCRPCARAERSGQGGHSETVLAHVALTDSHMSGMCSPNPREETGGSVGSCLVFGNQKMLLLT